MENLGYYNGKFGPLEEMQIPMLDRACYFGDGVYDFSLAYNGKIFALDEHVDRLYRSASMIEIEIPYTKAAEPRLEIMFFRMRERRRIS